MKLKDKNYFYFTQNSLSTFKNCPFKFKKKYMDNIKWQQDESDRATEKIEFGIDFHKVAERYFKGIEIFEESFEDKKELYNAYKNLVNEFEICNDNLYYPEYTIRFSDGDIRLEANIDLIIIKGTGEVTIVDWKTNANMKSTNKYTNSIQTSVYMFAVRKCFKSIFNMDIESDKVKMVYFSPENSKMISKINYSDDMFSRDEKMISDLINSVYEYDYDNFNKSAYTNQCKFCEFNNFCSNNSIPKKNELKRFDWDDIVEVNV